MFHGFSCERKRWRRVYSGEEVFNAHCSWCLLNFKHCNIQQSNEHMYEARHVEHPIIKAVVGIQHSLRLYLLDHEHSPPKMVMKIHHQQNVRFEATLHSRRLKIVVADQAILASHTANNQPELRAPISSKQPMSTSCTTHTTHSQ